MVLTQQNIERHPHVLPILRERARLLLALHADNPRSAGLFATHQRWLLAHMALQAHFENARVTGRAGMHAARVAALSLEAGVSSRNTAEAFLREIVAYGFVETTPDVIDHRIRWLVIAPHALKDVSAWAYGNLATLDAFDRGERARTFTAAPQTLGILQPVAARHFVTSPDIRQPGATFALFDGVDEGGGVMDRLISTCEDVADPQGRRLTGIAAIADFGDHLRLSRSHLTRKLREAEAQGALGWTAARGRSPIWISDAFVAEYIKRIAAELAAIESGYQAAFPATP
jgi:hypothetical protein